MDSSFFYQGKTIFILLNIANLLVMWKVGCKLKYCSTAKSYWKTAIWIVLSYSVIMGLRFGRMIDYNVYYERYIDIGRHFESVNYEFLFKFVCWLMYNVGIPYQGFIWFLSVLLIGAVLYLVKDYKNYAPYICILFLWEAHNAELFIRWYMAFAFFIVAFVQFKHQHYIGALIFSVFALTSHIGSILIVVAVLGLSVIRRQLLPSFLVEILFIASLFLGSVGMLDFLTPYIIILNLDDRSTHYVESFDRIINGEYGIVGFSQARSWANFIRIVMAYSFPIFFQSVLIKRKIISYLEGNIFIVGVIIFPILAQVEILNRFGEAFLFFSIITSSLSYGYVFNNMKQFSSLTFMLAVISMISNYWPVLSAILYRQHWFEMLYIWDAGNRDTLPLQLFIDTYK